jgi:glycosyltransferase involved in cell wall biosynthesis
MGKTPKVSVIIPTYNQSQYLAVTIRSALDQTLDGDIEVIVVDDGSTDSTPELVRNFPIRYVRQENRGVACARNTGIELARGEYIAFLDSDDVLLQNALRRGVAVLDKHSEIGFSYGQAYLTDQNGRVSGIWKSRFSGQSTTVDTKEQVRQLLLANVVPTGSVIVRRSCLDEVGGFQEGLRITEDRLMWIRLAKRYPAAYIAEPLQKYRIHADSLSHRPTPEAAEEAFCMIVREVFDDPNLAIQLQAWKNQAYFNFYRRRAFFTYGRDMKLTRRYVGQAFRVYPRSLLSTQGLALTFLYAKSLLRSLLRENLWRILRRLRRPPPQTKEFAE